MQQISTWMFTQRPLLLQKLAQIFLCKQWIEIGRVFGQAAFDAVSVGLKKSLFKGVMVVVFLLLGNFGVFGQILLSEGFELANRWKKLAGLL